MVASGFQRMWVDFTDVPSEEHEDLWLLIAGGLAQLPAQTFRVCHVASHADPEQASSEVDAWLAHWNNVADVQARRAQSHRPDTFKLVWRRYQQELLETRRQLALLRGFHLALAEDRRRCAQVMSSDEVTEDQAVRELSASERRPAIQFLGSMASPSLGRPSGVARIRLILERRFLRSASCGCSPNKRQQKSFLKSLGLSWPQLFTVVVFVTHTCPPMPINGLKFLRVVFRNLALLLLLGFVTLGRLCVF